MVVKSRRALNIRRVGTFAAENSEPSKIATNVTGLLLFATMMIGGEWTGVLIKCRPVNLKQSPGKSTLHLGQSGIGSSGAACILPSGFLIVFFFGHAEMSHGKLEE